MPNDNTFFERLSRLASDTATAAEGLHQDVETFVRNRLERALRDMDVVPREEFEAVKALAVEASLQCEHAKTQLAALEKRLICNRPVKNTVKKRFSVRKL